MRNRLVVSVSSITLIFILVIFNACSDTTVASSDSTIPSVYNRISTYYLGTEGDFVVIKVYSRPDHKSPYYLGTQWQTELYEAYNGGNPNYQQNPHKIAEFNLTFKIPKNPVVASNHQSTPMGPIGVALNGVPFFNQYAAGGVPLTNEINSFEQYGGHPAPNNMYHYHIEPLYLTTLYGKSSLLGFLLDGFPVYGPEENGATVTNAQLDSYHGHSHATVDYPNGIYHYHITYESPYINGDGFYGTPGTVTQ